MRFLLDELYPPAVAEQLRRHGHDAVSVQELERSGTSDKDLWSQVVQDDERVFVTENAKDLVPLAQSVLERGGHHPGLVVTSNRSLPRHRDGGVGPLVTALARLAEQSTDLRDRIEWLAA